MKSCDGRHLVKNEAEKRRFTDLLAYINGICANPNDTVMALYNSHRKGTLRIQTIKAKAEARIYRQRFKKNGSIYVSIKQKLETGSVIQYLNPFYRPSGSKISYIDVSLKTDIVVDQKIIEQILLYGMCMDENKTINYPSTLYLNNLSYTRFMLKVNHNSPAYKSKIKNIILEPEDIERIICVG